MKCRNTPLPHELLAMLLEKAKYLYRADRGPEFIDALVHIARWCAGSPGVEELSRAKGSGCALRVAAMRFAARAWLGAVREAWDANERGDARTQHAFVEAQAELLWKFVHTVEEVVRSYADLENPAAAITA